MTTSPKLGRPPELIDAVRISLTMPRADIAYLRKHFPSASEGVRSLIAGHKPETKTHLDVSIAELRMSDRTVNGLRSEKIFTIRELLSQTRSQLLLIPNFGRRNCTEVETALSARGLKLFNQ